MDRFDRPLKLHGQVPGGLHHTRQRKRHQQIVAPGIDRVTAMLARDRGNLIGKFGDGLGDTDMLILAGGTTEELAHAVTVGNQQGDIGIGPGLDFSQYVRQLLQAFRGRAVVLGLALRQFQGTPEQQAGIVGKGHVVAAVAARAGGQTHFGQLLVGGVEPTKPSRRQDRPLGLRLCDLLRRDLHLCRLLDPGVGRQARQGREPFLATERTLDTAQRIELLALAQTHYLRRPAALGLLRQNRFVDPIE